MHAKKMALWAGAASLALTGLMAGVGHADPQPDPVTGGVPFTADNVGLAEQGYEQSLDANGSGDQVITYTTHGGTIQQWHAIERVGDTFLLQNVYKPGQCVKAPTQVDQPLTMANCNKASTYQRWIERTVNGNDVFQLAGNHDRAIQATGVNSVAKLALFDPGNTLQQWSVESIN